MRNFVFIVVLGHLFFISGSVSAQSSDSTQRQRYLSNLFNRTLLFDTTHVRLKENGMVKTDSMEAWKGWRTVENFFYGKNRGSLPMIADLQALHPYFRDKVAALIRVCKAAGITLAIVESYRTPAKQAEYYAMGRKYTSSPGGKSRHQYGLAVDVVPMVDAAAVWDNARLWRKIGMAGERLGLRWGGRWRVLYDPGHFEWSGGLTKQQLLQGNIPSLPTSISDQYPRLEGDLRRLQVFWKAWEVEQSSVANKGDVEAEGDRADSWDGELASGK